MDNSNLSNNRQTDYLGVNKIGRNIRKSPLHQPNFGNNGTNSNGANNNGNGIIGSSPARQPSQPHVYNISKNDFRSIVQQLTGSPSHNDLVPRPPNVNSPKSPSMRLQRIRPPPLRPIHRPPMVVSQAPLLPRPQGQPMPMAPHQVHFNNNFGRVPPQFGQLSPRGMQPVANGDGSWTTPALSPISAYMQQLQGCIGGGPKPGQQYMQHQMPVQNPAQHHMQPQVNGYMQPQGPQPPILPNPQVQVQPPSSGLLPNPNVPPLLSPGSGGPGLLPSPTSQFLLPSPGGYFNVLSPTPRSPYPLLSPGSQFPPPLSPNFSFSPFGPHGILGSGPQPPLSPGISFPSSPSGFFPLISPRWRDQ